MTDQMSDGSDQVLGDARRALPPSSNLDARLARLNSAVEALHARTTGGAVENAAAVIERASGRLRLSADHTVVALAGATGSGKSSTFNALTGLDVAAVGVRRPTTSWAMACLWGSSGAEGLLEWLGIPQRHQVVRDSLLDPTREDEQMRGMVLLDLPDHDSTEVAHQLEMNRLVHLADVIVWVMDPQKYADAAIHDRLLRPNVQHAGVMVAVVNHMDEVAEEGRERLYSDARRLLDADGLQSVPLIATSARYGTGIEELRAELATRVADKASSRQRISTDVEVAARRLEEELGKIPPLSGMSNLRSRMITLLAEAGQSPDGGIAARPVLPEAVRNIVRSELRGFVTGASAVVAGSIVDQGTAQVDALVAELAGPRPVAQPQAVGRRGVGTPMKVLFFLVLLASGGWLAAAKLENIPNVLAASVMTGVAALVFLLSFVVRTSSGSRAAEHEDLEGALGSALDRTVMRAVNGEVRAYEQIAADIRAAVGDGS